MRFPVGGEMCDIEIFTRFNNSKRAIKLNKLYENIMRNTN